MSNHEQQQQQEQPEQHHDDDPMLILLAFVAAAGFGSGVPLLGLVGLLACAGHIAAKVDPTGAPARLLAAAAQQPGRLLSAAQHPAPVAEGDQSDTQPAMADVFDLLTSGRHVLLVGSTGGGKSTLLHNLAALHAKQRASVLVIDVDAIAGSYPGYRVLGCGDDYDAAKAGLNHCGSHHCRSAARGRRSGDKRDQGLAALALPATMPRRAGCTTRLFRVVYFWQNKKRARSPDVRIGVGFLRLVFDCAHAAHLYCSIVW
jgi:hypothetical protein